VAAEDSSHGGRIDGSCLAIGGVDRPTELSTEVGHQEKTGPVQNAAILFHLQPNGVSTRQTDALHFPEAGTVGFAVALYLIESCGNGSSTAAPMSQYNAVGDRRHTSLPYSTDTHGHPHPEILEQAPSRTTTAFYSFASLRPQMDRGSLSQEPRPGPLLARQRAVEKRPGHGYTLNKTI